MCFNVFRLLTKAHKTLLVAPVNCVVNLKINRVIESAGLVFDGGPGSVVGIPTAYGLDGPGIESRWGRDISAPVQTGPEAHPASSCTVGTGSFPVVRCDRGVTVTPHPLLVPRSKIE